MTIPARIKNLHRKLLPADSWRYQFVRRALERYQVWRTDSLAYDQWIYQCETKGTKRAPSKGPIISIIVPAYNTPDKYLQPLLDSVIGQTYRNWQLILVNGSPDKARSESISRAVVRDVRICEVLLSTNDGIAATTNAGLRMAKGEFIAFMDHDDTLAPFALAEVAIALESDPDIDVFYSDEDKLSDDGRIRLDPFFKPDWSPDLFFGVNYLAHFIVVRRELARKVNGVRLGYDGAQDYDFLLRILDCEPKIHHIPRISYHWRLADGSTAKAVDQKDYADDAGRRALTDYVERNHIAALVQQVPGHSTNYRLQYIARNDLKVAIKGPFARELVRDIEESGLKLVDEGSDVTVFLASDLTIKGSGLVAELAGLAMREDHGMCGALAVDSSGRIADAGYLTQNGVPEPVFRGIEATNWTHCGQPAWPRDLIIPPLSCCLVRTDLIRDMMNLEPFHIAVELHKKGLLNVCWPYVPVQLTHEPEGIFMSEIRMNDPFLNPNIHIKDNRPMLGRPHGSF